MNRIGRHLLSIDDLDRSSIERILDRAESFDEVSGREIKKVPALRGRTIVNLFYESSTRTSSIVRARGQAAQRRRGLDPLAGVGRRQGRVAQGHRADAVGVRPGGDRDPLAPRRRGRAGGALDAGGGHQRRRRQARAPDAGAARRVHPAPAARLARRRQHLDRRRRAPFAGGALEHPRVHADGRDRHRVRTADADPA